MQNIRLLFKVKVMNFNKKSSFLAKTMINKIQLAYF